MVRPRYKPVTPDQRIRELRKEFRALQKEEPGIERGARAAEFARTAHLERQLNMSMHCGAMALEDDPDAPKMLVDAYTDDVEDPEERLRAFVDLQDLARYLEREDIRAHAEASIASEARTWVKAADETEQRHRLRTLTSMISREFADTIRDELRFL